MNAKISFEVQGSTEEPYSVTFEKRSVSNLSAYCSCPAGKAGKSCKHRLTILEGDGKSITSGNISDIKIVQSWLIGTDLEKAITKYKALESEAEAINNALSSAKKEVAKAMRD